MSHFFLVECTDQYRFEVKDYTGTLISLFFFFLLEKYDVVFVCDHFPVENSVYLLNASSFFFTKTYEIWIFFFLVRPFVGIVLLFSRIRFFFSSSKHYVLNFFLASLWNET